MTNVFESSRVDNLIDKHHQNLEFLRSGVDRIEALKQVSNFAFDLESIGFKDMIAFLGADIYFSVIKKSVMIDEITDLSKYLDSLLENFSEFDYPCEYTQFLSDSISKSSSEFRSDVSLLNVDLIDMYKSISLDVNFNLRVMDLYIQNYILDIKDHLHEISKTYLHDIYAEIVFYSKLNQTLNSVKNINLSEISENQNAKLPVLNILGYYRDQYLNYFREFMV